MVRAGTGWARLGLAVAALLALAVPSAASADSSVSKRLSGSAADVRAYWTPERMAKALPGELLSSEPVARAAATEEALAGTDPAPRATAVSNTTTYPARTHGKVFFSLGGVDYVCSGTVVNAPNRKLVATAGHCVFSEGEFASDWMFAPGYRPGSSPTPFGEWVGRRLSTTPEWRASEDLRFDLGLVNMRKKEGRRLQNVVGARGIAFGLGRDRTYVIHGYPADGEFDGTQLYTCRSGYQGADTSFDSPSPMRITCDQTAGSSGGGWVIKGGRVNSVISYGYDCTLPLFCGNEEEGKLFGPYFGSVAEDLYVSVRGKRRR